MNLYDCYELELYFVRFYVIIIVTIFNTIITRHIISTKRSLIHFSYNKKNNNNA